ncbi:MAG: radical SAM protein, partial [Lachnospiraceae bacterium]|nr:radical SAM protein [Lachnospiraceae bacterium]
MPKLIKEVLEYSAAFEAGIRAGDSLLLVNGSKIGDIFDYQFECADTEIDITVLHEDGSEETYLIEKSEDEDPGLIFEDGIMDDYRRCRNKCIFCFIDQMPEGMRETLYFKDDDSRLSFLQGNYVTLTNMSDEDIERIIRYNLEPINISFQTTNPELRNKMMGNRFAGEALKKADRLFEAGVRMNGQIVLCKGINDGKELERSISDLSRYIPYLESVSVVPVGLSRFREGLYPLEPFD